MANYRFGVENFTANLTFVNFFNGLKRRKISLQENNENSSARMCVKIDNILNIAGGASSAGHRVNKECRSSHRIGLGDLIDSKRITD